MRWAAALATAATAFIAVGVATGKAPAFASLRSPTARASRRSHTWLTQAGLGLTPAQFWLASGATGVLTFAVLTALTATPVVAAPPAAVAGMIPRVYFSRRRRQRLRAVQAEWPDGLRELRASIAAGMSLGQALCELAATGPEGLRRAFARFPVLLRVLGFVPALEVVKAELADPASDRIIEVLILAHERGGSIVGDVLRDLAEAATEDARTLEHITTSGLEQKINARAVFALPWLVLLLLTARPGHFRAFYQSQGGVLVVVAAAALSLAGMWLVGRLAADPEEERVFGSTERAP